MGPRVPLGLQALAGNARPAVTDNNGCVSTELKASGVDARAEFNPNAAPTELVLILVAGDGVVLARFGHSQGRPDGSRVRRCSMCVPMECAKQSTASLF